MVRYNSLLWPFLLGFIGQITGLSLGPPPGSAGTVDWRYPDEITNALPDCLDVGTFPHPNNCRWYYRCFALLDLEMTNHFPTEALLHRALFECEPGTIFADDLDQCVWATEIPNNCTSSYTFPSSSTTFPSISGIPDECSFEPDFEYCKLYLCSLRSVHHLCGAVNRTCVDIEVKNRNNQFTSTEEPCSIGAIEEYTCGQFPEICTPTETPTTTTTTTTTATATETATETAPEEELTTASPEEISSTQINPNKQTDTTTDNNNNNIISTEISVIDTTTEMIIIPTTTQTPTTTTTTATATETATTTAPEEELTTASPEEISSTQINPNKQTDTTTDNNNNNIISTEISVIDTTTEMIIIPTTTQTRGTSCDHLPEAETPHQEYIDDGTCWCNCKESDHFYFMCKHQEACIPRTEKFRRIGSSTHCVLSSTGMLQNYNCSDKRFCDPYSPEDDCMSPEVRTPPPILTCKDKVPLENTPHQMYLDDNTCWCTCQNDNYFYMCTHQEACLPRTGRIKNIASLTRCDGHPQTGVIQNYNCSDTYLFCSPSMFDEHCSGFSHHLPSPGHVQPQPLDWVSSFVGSRQYF